MKLKYISVAIASMFAAAGAASAQQSPANSTEAAVPAGDKAKTSEKLETVTVTARRREESLQDVPVAVTAFSGQQLKELNVQNLGDLANAGSFNRAYSVEISSWYSCQIQRLRKNQTLLLLYLLAQELIHHCSPKNPLPPE